MYDNPRNSSIHFAAVDFGAGSNEARVIAVPLDENGIGMRGRVKGALIHNVTEDFAGSSSDAGVRVGDGSDDDKYYDSGLVLDETVDIGESVYLVDDGAAVDIEAGRTNITVTFVVAAGTPTGIADVELFIDWY